MNEELRRKASELANRPYVIHVFLHETTDGKEVYVTKAPALQGCTAHGKTVESAKARLRDAMVDYIYFLLEDGFEVPFPDRFESGVPIQIWFPEPIQGWGFTNQTETLNENPN